MSTTLARERAVCLRDAEVRTLLAEGVVEVRREILSSPNTCPASWEQPHVEQGVAYPDLFVWMRGGQQISFPFSCPLGAPDDRLWGREKWNRTDPDEAIPGELLGPRAPFQGVKHPNTPILWRAVYAATSPAAHPVFGKCRWRSPATMPRWASRLALVNAGVRVERADDGTWEWVVMLRRVEASTEGGQ